MLSLVSYPERGPWGDHRYPGNFSGHLVRDLISFFQPKRVADPAEGSGTTRHVCQALGVSYAGADLREGFDLGATPLSTWLPWRPDLIVFHPPYFRIIRYSGSAWGNGPDPRDLSQEDDWPRYLDRLLRMVERCREALAPGGRVAVVIGDVRDRGHYFSAQAALLGAYPPEAIETVLIKAQHHVRSDREQYSGRFIRIMHEYVVVLRAGAVPRPPTVLRPTTHPDATCAPRPRLLARP